MDEIKNLYFRIENPIDNKEKWSKILNKYSSSDNYEEFLDSLLKKKKDDSVYYDEEVRNNFFLTMWSFFKRLILSYTEDELNKMIEEKIFESNVFDAISNIRDLPSVKNIDTLMTILNNKDINEYFSMLFRFDNGNVFISSSFLNSRNSENNVLVSFTIDSSKLYTIVKTYIMKAIEREIPYLVTFNEYGKRSVVKVYSSTQNIKTNEDIISIIKS